MAPALNGIVMYRKPRVWPHRQHTFLNVRNWTARHAEHVTVSAGEGTTTYISNSRLEGHTDGRKDATEDGDLWSEPTRVGSSRMAAIHALAAQAMGANGAPGRADNRGQFVGKDLS